MNENAPVASRMLILAGWVVACLGLRPAPVQAQAPGSSASPREVIERADELYQLDQLVRAEEVYRHVVDRTEGPDRRHCFDRLLAIYVRVGRHDQAIRTGLQYERWLRQAGDLIRVRDLDLDLGGWYVVLGHYAAAEPHLRRALAALPRDPLPPARRIVALTYLALAAEKQGDRERATQAWGEVEAYARTQLEAPGKGLTPSARIECARRLAEAYRFQKRPAEAIVRLEQALPAFDDLKDPAGLRDTLRQLAGQLAATKRYGDAEQRLKQALTLHQEHAAADLLTRADLTAELAGVVQRQGRQGEAAPLRQQAARDYRAVLAKPGAGRPEVAGALAAFWRLEQLYQRTSQYDRALKLAQDQSAHWSGGVLVEPRLHAEQGRLQMFLGHYGPSRPLLAAAVRDLEQQEPANLVELPPALVNLAVAELATGSHARAEELGGRCLALYRKYRLPEDLVLVETYNLLGTCAAQDGDYALAIERFRTGAALCARLGPAADPPRSNLLLNVALLHKVQGDLERALAVCREAATVYRRFAPPDALGFAALGAAEAGLLAAQARIVEANALTDDILRLCARHGIRGGPLVVTARHCQALAHLYRREFPAAERSWREVEKLHGEQSPLRPRTLNYLALTHECRQQFDEAEALYRAARRLQQANPRAFPVTHFTTLWRLANVADRRQRHAEARALLEEAVTVVERARLRTYGDAQQRAGFFAQFAPAFEQLVAWGVRDGDVATAAVAAARGRSRTLLDQLLLANVDPRSSLKGPGGERLRKQEAESLRRLAALRARILTIAPDALETDKARQLLSDFDAAERAYTEVHREVLNASPLYHNLGQREFAARDLERLSDRLGPKKLVLVYHIGRRESYLLLLGDRQRPGEAFALTVPANVAERAAAPAPASLTLAMSKTRGVALRASGPQPELPPSAATPPAAVPLTQAVLRALVENYLNQIADPSFRPTRGLRLQSQDPARPLPPQRPELLGDVLLPPAVLARIQALAPASLVIVLDGALHKLPFEALLLRAGDRPSYVLDELPPLTYAPSLAILAVLAERAPAAPAGPVSLLTVADPAYPTRASALGTGPPGLSLLGSELVRLPHTATESVRIGRCFDARQVTALRGEQAREPAVVAALSGRHAVHIAAHGLADERFGNQFGALALTPPPGQAVPGDDGFLSLHEIYLLPLGECELAVLSACVTNVGPQQPLEAGVTLASGFLTAGARRVVASHWSVDDESTAVLMELFFREVTAAARAGRPVAYAAALQQARRQVRARPDWSAPYFWAPFVVVGPPD